MKLHFFAFIFCTALLLGIVAPTNQAEGQASDNTLLPGSAISLEKVVSSPEVELVAKGVILRLGSLRPRLGTTVYPGALFKITKVLKGISENPVKLVIFVDDEHHETLKEGVEYVVFASGVENGFREAGKFMSADQQTLSKIVAAIAAAPKPPAITH